MAVNINVPSQVKTYANLAAFPATGALKTIYIAEDTNKTYRWTGSVYVEVSASASGITIGSTAIASGVVGRVLFEGAGNVVQESSSLFWDNTNAQLQIVTSNTTSAFRGLSVTQYGDFIGGAPIRFDKARGTSASPANVNSLDIVGAFTFNPRVGGALTQDRALFGANMASSTGIGVFIIGGTADNTYTPGIYVHPSNNVTIGSGQSIITGITDAGFRLDVNGTARVKTDLKIETATGGLIIEGDASGYPTLKINTLRSGTTRRNWMFATEQINGGDFILFRSATAGGVANTLVYSIFNDGNFGLNTSTNAGFRLDVNGTARVKGTGTSISTFAFNVENSAGTETFRVYDNGLVRVLGGAIVMNGSNGSFTAGFIGTAGQIGAGTTSVSASAQLEISSTTRGFLPPRMTTTQKNAIASPATGLQVYDTTLNRPCFYDGTTWITL